MFKKPFKVKSNFQLKGSDRKRLCNEILQQFSGLSEDSLDVIIPNKGAVTVLKIKTCSEVVVTVYLIQKLPVVFELEKVMYPTIYMLWKVPDLLHTFTTHPEIFPTITGGADLMLPEVVLPHGNSLQAYGTLQKGDRVAINLTTNKAPIAIGIAANSSNDMYMSGKRGKCVNILHFYGDFLSKYGNEPVIPELGPVVENVTDQSSKGCSTTCEQWDGYNTLKIDIEKISINSDNIGFNNVPEEPNEPLIVASEVGVKNVCEESTFKTFGPSQTMDDLLQYCFIKSLMTTMRKVDLPILTSNFYKLHMIPACPNGNTLDIKISSYKKLSTFLDEMVKLGTITVETIQKGVQSITKIDYSSELVKTFIDDRPISSRNIENSISVDNLATNKSTIREITELYTVTAAVSPLFYMYDYKKQDLVKPSVVRKVISDYVRVKDLQNLSNKKEVIIDDVLRRASNTPHNVKILLWNQLVSSVFQQMGHSYKVEVGDSEVGLPLTKENLRPIDIQVGIRSGNKKVTLVNNLELFGINLTDFSRECQHGAAASTTINTLPSAKSPQLQIQGNQVTFLGKLLMEKYQIPKRFIRGLENAPKKRKQCLKITNNLRFC